MDYDTNKATIKKENTKIYTFRVVVGLKHSILWLSMNFHSTMRLVVAEFRQHASIRAVSDRLICLNVSVTLVL